MRSKRTTVYKYFDISTKERKKRVKEIFEDNKLWFSNPEKFNDPLEFSFLPLFNASKKQKLKKCTQFQIETYGFCRKSAESRAKVLMRTPRCTDSWERENLRGLKKNLYSKIRLSSFSKVANDILMWSHYADGHKGICIRFSCNDKQHKVFFKKIFNVKYPEDNSQPKFNFYREDLGNFCKKVLLAKAKCWKYEKERRGIHINSQENYRIIPEGVIDGIILGMKFKKRNLEFIKGIKKRYNKKPLKIYKTRLDDKKYKLIIEEKSL